ncbi:MAG: DUF1822 family protein [Cyanobacteriota bacterium]|nr:DUF1822 family protein [Cyanobacteriota bacterium]
MFTHQNAMPDLGYMVSELDAIELEASDFEQAMILSNPIAPETKQWQTYLNALALLGLER